MIGFLLSKSGLTLMLAVFVAGIIGIDHLRIGSLKKDVATEKAALAASESRLQASEVNRAAEYAKATKALSDAENACSVRVADAAKAGVIIKRIVTRPVVVDQKGCPVRETIPASELRAAVQP